MPERREARADWWRGQGAGAPPGVGADPEPEHVPPTLLPMPAGLRADERAAGSDGEGRATLTHVNAVGPTLLLVLGAALGVATQMSDNGSMSLRVPALFAALFMVAQGLFELDRMHRTRLADRATEAVDAGHHQQHPRGGHGGAPAAQAGPSAQARMAIPVVLMVLAAWLGLAVLRGAGGDDVPLEVLATLSAFLLFAIGWQVLLGAR